MALPKVSGSARPGRTQDRLEDVPADFDDQEIWDPLVGIPWANSGSRRGKEETKPVSTPSPVAF